MTATDDAAVEDGPPEDAEEVAEPAMLHGCPVVESSGQQTVHVGRDGYLDLVKALADEGYTTCADLCGVDYLEFADRSLPAGVPRERFEVVANLLDITNRRRVRVRVQVPAEDPVVASLFDLYPGTEAMEREAFDMFGIAFSDHPDLTRILMPEDWEGHPLRKDYEVGRIPVQFKGANA